LIGFDNFLTQDQPLQFNDTKNETRTKKF